MTMKKSPSTAEMRSRVLIVDDHPMTRYGIVRLIEQEPDLVVCGEAENASRALAAVRALKPQVILADLTMPGGEGLEFIKDVRSLHPEIAVLVVSMHDEALYAERALRAGARGYIMKNEGGEKLVEAIRQVLQGENLREREHVWQGFGDLLRPPPARGRHDHWQADRPGV